MTSADIPQRPEMVEDAAPAQSSVMAGSTLGSLALLRLLQLCSPALPVGAFAYSHGLEWAVEQGWVHDAYSTERWIGGLISHGWSRLDVPVLKRLHGALAQEDARSLAAWCAMLVAQRESAELLAEDLHLGSALARLAVSLEVPGAEGWSAALPDGTRGCPYVLALAGMSRHWGVPVWESALACLWTATEQVTAAAVKLVPLGQTQGQQILQNLAERIPPAAHAGLNLRDEDIGAVLPGLAIASARHEHQYTRLFRS